MIAWLAPGQGSQHPGMFAGADPGELDRAVREASHGAGHDLHAAFRRSDFAHEARATQLALLVCAVASGRELLSAGATFDAAAGHSVGAFAAAVLAGVLPLDRAAAIVDARARLMEGAFRDEYGMAAIVGLDLAAVDALVADAGGAEAAVYRANVNGARQIVVAGERAGLARALTLAHSRGARTARMLDVAVASHCELLEPIAQQLHERFGREHVEDPRVPIAGNVGGRLLRDGRLVLEDALSNIAHPVRWDLAAGALYEAGVRLFIELRPGHVLADLVQSELPDARGLSLEEAGVAGAVALAERTLRLP